ncbi:MAG: ATP-dependent Clp protease proteolytic subunit [Fusobacteriaceae bacterium]
MRINKNKSINMEKGILNDMLQPTVYTGLEKKSTYILFFNDQVFEHNTIENIICVLEDVKMSESYDCIKIYMSSLGGMANQLMLVADYLNNYPLNITFVVTDLVASCGSLLPLMVKRAEIEYSPLASAMFHLAHTFVHSSAMYDNRANMYGASADLKGITDLNNYLYNNFYSKLDLTSEEKGHIRNGKDVFVDNSRIEHIFETFKDRQFYEEDFSECVSVGDNRIEELKREIEDLENWKNDMYSDMEKFKEEHGLDDFDSETSTEDETELNDEFKIGLTD